MIRYRRFIVSKHRSTNSLPHALRLIARGFGRDMADTRPAPKYKWLKEDVFEAKH
jgi:hypothetical protein